MKKHCSRCKQWLLYDNFYKKCTTKDGYNYACITCIKLEIHLRDPDKLLTKQYHKNYYLKHKEKLLTRSAKWKTENKDKKKKVDKDWCLKNYQHKKEKHKQWYITHRVEILQKAKKYREQHKEHRKQVNYHKINLPTHFDRD